jgi:hypothetical protein
MTFGRASLGLILGLFGVANQASATLLFQSTYFGYHNDPSATDTTVVTTANAGYAALYGNNFTNLFLNGGFEFGNTNKGADGAGWGTGTNNMAYFTAGRPAANSTTIPDWTASGTTASNTNNLNGGPYGLWGNQGTSIANGAPIVQGSNAVYFGDAVADASHNGLTTGTPTYGADGRVTWAGMSIKPGNFGGGNNQAVQLSQTVTGLKIGDTYIFSFWVTGEDAAGGARARDKGDGVFGLTVSGEPNEVVNGFDGIGVTQLLAAPYTTVPAGFDSTRTAGFAGSHYYQYIFIPTSTSATFTFTNWGHISFDGTSGNRASELILDDVVLFDGSQSPEPATFALAGLGLAGLLLAKRFRRGGRAA